MEQTTNNRQQTTTSDLHIISFNIPFPANYGGVIDVFYKLKALREEGITIHLHCFEYGRYEAKRVLIKYCQTIHYYKRSTTFVKQLSTTPFIVNSRDSKRLLETLLKDDYPIVFEGLHCCALLNHPKLKHRQKIVRMHNVEWQYYEHLASLEKDFVKKNYFKLEAIKLKRFEKVVENADALLAISQDDLNYFQKKYPSIDTQFVPAFHPNEKVNIKSGRGDYALFHGDLSVKDNEESALWLINEVFQSVDYQLIIVGLNPSDKLKNRVDEFKHISLEANVSEERMTELIQNAHVNVLLSFQSAGMKLKLLNALYRGRFCLVNTQMVSDARLEELCFIENKGMEFQNTLKKLFGKTFSEEEILKREKILNLNFSNKNSAEKIITLLPQKR